MAAATRSVKINNCCSIAKDQMTEFCLAYQQGHLKLAPNVRRVVILGKTGAGKSSLGNTIVGKDQFNVCHGFNSDINPCQTKTQPLNGKEITVIDTPGFFDTNTNEESLKPEIVSCITECSPGPHAFLIVLQLGRFTKQENETIKKITECFSEDVFRYATVVFTHGDELPEGQEIREYLSSNASVRELVRKCGGRCHIIDNKYWNNRSNEEYRSNAYQVKNLLESIEEILKANNGNCYTNEMLQAVEKLKQQEVQRIAESSENISKKEMEAKAKSRVCDILNKAAGITTGVVLGALFGVAAAVAALAAIAKAAIIQTRLVTIKVRVVGSVPETAAETVPETAAGTSTLGFTAGAVVFGGAAVAGAGFGAHEGYRAAKEAESPLDAATKTAEALWSSGNKLIKGVEKLGNTFDQLAQDNNEKKQN